MIDVLSGNPIRTQQALLTALFSTARAQFSFANDLIEDVGETLRNTGLAADHATLVETLITRFRDRTENTIAELQRISDELRDNSRARLATGLTHASTALTAQRTVTAADPAATGALAERPR